MKNFGKIDWILILLTLIVLILLFWEKAVQYWYEILKMGGFIL